MRLKDMRRTIIIGIVSLLLTNFTNLYAQKVLTEYVREGLKNNVVLQQKNISYQRASTSLSIATSYFFPSMSLQSSYMSGEGGRAIELPIGTLLNPVYKTLNQLTQSNAFPQVDDVKQDFLPSKFYDVKVRTMVPLVNTDLYFNRNIQADQVRITAYDIEMYKKELIKDITIAYFNVLRSESVLSIFDNAMNLAIEGKRVNESLLQNGKGLPVYILRSNNEIETIESRRSEARSLSTNARRYFNFLLNRDLNAAIDVDFSITDDFDSIHSPQDSSVVNNNREELNMLRHVVNINESIVDLNKYWWIPKVGAFVDLGIQDQWLKSSNQSRYYLVGVQLEVPLFDAFRSQHQTDRAELDLANSQLNLKLTKQRLQLSTSVAFNELTDAKQQFRSAVTQVALAKSYCQMILKGYREGVNQFIETIDARTQLLNAELALNINTYKVCIALAQYKRETGNNTSVYE